MCGAGARIPLISKGVVTSTQFLVKEFWVKGILKIKVTNGAIFSTSQDIVIGPDDVPGIKPDKILHSNIKSASLNSGIWTITIKAQTFKREVNGGGGEDIPAKQGPTPVGTCEPATTNTACSSISTPANQGACDAQSLGTCAGGSDTKCTNVANGLKATCVGTNDDTGNACAWTSTNLCTYSASLSVSSKYKTLCTDSARAFPSQRGLYCHDASGLCSTYPRGYGYTIIQDLLLQDSTRETCATYGLGTMTSIDDCKDGLKALTDFKNSDSVPKVEQYETAEYNFPGCSLDPSSDSSGDMNEKGIVNSKYISNSKAPRKPVCAQMDQGGMIAGGFCVCLNAPKCRDDIKFFNANRKAKKITPNKSPCVCGINSCSKATGFFCEAAKSKCRCPYGHFKNPEDNFACQQCRKVICVLLFFFPF